MLFMRYQVLILIKTNFIYSAYENYTIVDGKTAFYA